ncbi:hypothetical protein QAD02_005767 [Eretmocerus hayati]|uniref:Uncharacterized protein n=1 Tax=Eretmocerus hayati TaxID=131215 RepID=A0ACC2NY84_9HYME|nr:hypothetical protein QAD02_005767 [Eretmocerus hayati]
MSTSALAVLWLLLLSLFCPQKIESWRFEENAEEMNTSWDQWGPLSSSNEPEKENPTKIEAQQNCKRTPAQLKDFSYIAVVRVRYVPALRGRVSENSICIIITPAYIICNINDFEDNVNTFVEALLVADGAWHKAEHIHTTIRDITFYELPDYDIDEFSKASYIRVAEVDLDVRPGTRVTLVSLFFSDYSRWEVGIVRTEDVPLIAPPEDCAELLGVPRSDCNSYLFIENPKCYNGTTHDNFILLVQGKLVGLGISRDGVTSGERIIGFYNIAHNRDAMVDALKHAWNTPRYRLN